jgi:hypothetical protein
MGEAMMAKAPKPPKPDAPSPDHPTVRERVLLFCAASGTDWLHAGITGETVTAMVVKGCLNATLAGWSLDACRPIERLLSSAMMGCRKSYL